MGSIKLSHWYNPQAEQVGDTLYEFLNSLPGPTVIHLTGKDESRCRVVVTLLHANEPSGFRAIYQLIKNRFEPAVNTKFIIASVVAARTEPIFTHRMLPEQRDLNRCFGDNERDLQSLLAAAIKEEIQSYNAEAIIDLHNTSGSGPAFSVSVIHSPQHSALAAHFTHRLIITDLSLGSLMEQALPGPVITIEAGGSQDEEANVTAFEGIQSFLRADDVFAQKQELELLKNPRRLELQANASIAYAPSPLVGVDITMRQDIERLNFGKTKVGQVLGWLRKNDLSSLKLDNKRYDIEDYFALEISAEGECYLITKCSLMLFMVTTRADIASTDCLLYFVPA